MSTLRILRLPHADGLALPAYETAGSAGMDLRAAVPEDAPMTLEPGARALVPTGLKIALEQGWEAQIRPRSGLALKHGISAPNTPGTIDSDYRGEVGVILINLGRSRSSSNAASASPRWLSRPWPRRPWSRSRPWTTRRAAPVVSVPPADKVASIPADRR